MQKAQRNARETDEGSAGGQADVYPREGRSLKPPRSRRPPIGPPMGPPIGPPIGSSM